jgi:hypothetical protein
MTIKSRYKAAVAIPTHKNEFNQYEHLSLDRCLRVLGNYPIYLVVPEGMSVQKIKRAELQIKFLPADGFSSYRNYNNLIRSTAFYQEFLDYKYILLHELDAFVFSDQLSEWCDRHYDYIGAPLGRFTRDHNEYFRLYLPFWARKQSIRRILGIDNNVFCNGGFSLRNTKKFYSVALFYKNKISIWGKNDDMFWSAIAPTYFPFIKIPDENECLKFAYMLDVEESLKKHNGVLPFGCHGWPRYETDSWRKIFATLGYTI